MPIVKRAGALIAVLSVLVIGTAESAQPGFYVAGSVGQARHDVERGNDFLVILGPPTLPLLPPIGGIIGVPGPIGGFMREPAVALYSITVDDEDVSWSGVLGYRINKYVAAEVAYMDFGTADVTERYTFTFPTFAPVQLTRTFSVGVRGPAVSVLGSLPVGAFDIFVRGGVLFADEEVKLGPLATPASMSFSEEIWLAGVGVDWSFSTRWAARAEYQRTGKIDRNVSVGENGLEQFALSVLFRL